MTSRPSGQSPLAFEKQFEQNLDELEDIHWLPFKVRLLGSLFENLTTNLPEYQRISYFSELYGPLKGILLNICVNKRGTGGLDPRQLENLTDRFLHISRICSADSETDAYLVRQTAGCIGQAYLRLGAFDKTLSLFVRHELIAPRTVKEIDPEALSPDQFRSALCSRLPEEFIHWISPGNENRFHSSGNSLGCLFVIYEKGKEAGVLARLSLTGLSVRKKRGVDQVRIATHLVDETDILSDQTKAMCQFLRQEFDIGKNSFLRLEYSLDQPASLLTGNSIGLAMTLLAKIEMQMYHRNRAFQPRVYTDTAFTGSLNTKGEIQPVDAPSLREKTAAAFYSDCRGVVVPASQASLVARHLTQLQEDYPNRHLDIIPVSTFTELETRREVVFLQRRRLSRRLKQVVRDYANSVTYGIMGFIVISLAVFYFGFVKYPVPEDAEYVGTRLAVRNKFGFTLWYSEEYPHEEIWYIGDLNKDGKREMLISYSAMRHHGENSGKLVCYDEKGSPLWWVDAGEAVQYGDEVFDDFFQVTQLIVDDFNFDGTSEILAVSLQGGFPNRYFLISDTGKLISEYWHNGGLNEYIIADVIPDNGRKEIILAGRNNEYCGAVLLVLDPFVMRGQSPYEKVDFKKSDTVPGNEIYYLRFPYTHFRVPPYRDYVEYLTHNDKGEYNFAIFNNRNELQYLKGVVHYVLKNNFGVKTVRIADNYYKAYREIFPCGDPVPFTQTELVEHFKTIDYWDGDHWVKDATLNRRYLESLKSR